MHKAASELNLFINSSINSSLIKNYTFLTSLRLNERMNDFLKLDSWFLVRNLSCSDAVNLDVDFAILNHKTN